MFLQNESDNKMNIWVNTDDVLPKSNMHNYQKYSKLINNDIMIWSK